MIGQTALFAPSSDLPLRQRVTVALVTLAEARHALETFHYLHRCRTGRQLNYAVYIDGMIDGVVTYAHPVVIAPIDGVPAANVLEFARLYLASNIPHTATCAIGQTLRRIRRDWAREYPTAAPILLIVSWSDRERHVGTIYRAANFRWLKMSHGDNRTAPRTGGRRKWGVKALHPTLAHDKDCWIYRWTRPSARPARERCDDALASQP